MRKWRSWSASVAIQACSTPLLASRVRSMPLLRTWRRSRLDSLFWVAQLRLSLSGDRHVGRTGIFGLNRLSKGSGDVPALWCGGYFLSCARCRYGQGAPPVTIKLRGSEPVIKALGSGTASYSAARGFQWDRHSRGNRVGRSLTRFLILTRAECFASYWVELRMRAGHHVVRCSACLVPAS